jgi:hypothetical protein
MTYDMFKNKLDLLLSKEQNLSPVIALLFIVEFCTNATPTDIALMQIIARELIPNINLNKIDTYYSYRAKLFLYLEEIGDLRKKC